MINFNQINIQGTLLEPSTNQTDNSSAKPLINGYNIYKLDVSSTVSLAKVANFVINIIERKEITETESAILVAITNKLKVEKEKYNTSGIYNFFKYLFKPDVKAEKQLQFERMLALEQFIENIRINVPKSKPVEQKQVESIEVPASKESIESKDKKPTVSKSAKTSIPLLKMPKENRKKIYRSAHAIVLSKSLDENGKAAQYVLLGLTKKGTLSTFGGLRDPGERDSKSTAAREAEEESLGVLGTQKAIRRNLRGVKSISKEGSEHINYVVPATAKYHDHALLSKQFKAIRFDPNRKLPGCQREMVDIVAIRVDTLKEKILKGKPLEFEDNEGNLRRLRGGVKGAIRSAVKAGHI